MQMETPPTRSVTKSVTIDRPAAEVHAFLADAANWPWWAVINVLAVEPMSRAGRSCRRGSSLMGAVPTF
jgi:hypothetical protein